MGGVGGSEPGVFIATVAQLAERLICNLQVAGSNPAGGFRVSDTRNAVFLVSCGMR